MVGYLVRTPMGYAIRYETNGARHDATEPNGSGCQRLFQFGADAIEVGEQIFLTEPDGSKLRFRIAGLQ